MTDTPHRPVPRVRAERSDGKRSRAAILEQAAQLATMEGIEGLSIARLAAAVGMSKSGLFAHFGSKEELQLATIDRATTFFEESVTTPAAVAEHGLERLRLLADGYLDYIEADTFAGGCFFASVLSEVDTRPGAVRDRLVAFLHDWLARLDTTIREAQADGTIDPAEDPAQLAFEIEAALFLANAQYVVVHTSEPIDRGRAAIARRLAAARTKPRRSRS